MKIVTGIELEQESQYIWLRKNNGLWYGVRNGIDTLIGFNPNCIDQAIALEQSAEEKLQSVDDKLGQ